MSYDLDSLKDNINITDGFNLLHHNSRSLLAEGRLPDYGVLLESINNPFHIIGLSETWLNLENTDDAVIEGFDHIYVVRPTDCSINNKETGGGLSFLLERV